TPAAAAARRLQPSRRSRLAGETPKFCRRFRRRLFFPALAISELFDAIKIRAHVAVLACSRLDHVSSAIGQPIAPSYVPGTQSTYGEKMTIGQKFMNILHFVMGDFLFGYIGDEDYKVAKELIPGVRSWREVLPEASYIFTNHIPLMDFPAPTFDKIIPIGGISVKTQRKSLQLPEKWDKVLGLRKKNVLISFGSNARSIDMPEEFKKSILKVAELLPEVTFIWKYENEKDTLADHLENVYLGDWLPQNELLGDPRLSLFVTHGGLASVTELALMGKPAVMVPLFADQARNGMMLKRHGGATVLHKTDLADYRIIKKAIEEILFNDEYRKNAERLAKMLNNQPTDPKETLVKHVEFAARYASLIISNFVNATKIFSTDKLLLIMTSILSVDRFGQLPSMDPYGRQQSYFEYYLLDIISIGLLIIFVTSYVTFKILSCVFSLCCRNSSKKAKHD
ncbi:Protein CBG22339, partial [Caenorhabditis briggsae]